MKNYLMKTILVIGLPFMFACSQAEKINEEHTEETSAEIATVKKVEPHRYGGWYCPDNLNGFPAVDINNWQDVVVVNGRMATKEETQNGTSLIFVDLEKYPNAKPLEMGMPQLASMYNRSSNREELIIVIQALNIDNDSIIGFRYLNGGNGSARLSDVQFLSKNEIETIPSSRFVSHTITIETGQNKIWEILTNPEHNSTLEKIFNANNTLASDWRKTTNINFAYALTGENTAKYGDILYGCFYIQNDFAEYNEKFLLLEDEETHTTELKIVCGPFNTDYESQKAIIEKWAKKVKGLSEV